MFEPKRKHDYKNNYINSKHIKNRNTEDSRSVIPHASSWNNIYQNFFLEFSIANRFTVYLNEAIYIANKSNMRRCIFFGSISSF